MPYGIEQVAKPLIKNRELSLSDRVQYLRGVGEAIAVKFRKLQVETIYDLLMHIPSRYEDRSQLRRLVDIVAGEYNTVKGRLIAVENSETRRGFRITRAVINDGSGSLELVWFNQPYMRDILWKKKEREIVVYGLVQQGSYYWQMNTPEWEELVEDETQSQLRIVPVYPSTEGLQQARIRLATSNALAIYREMIREYLPQQFVDKRALLPPLDALQSVHFPSAMSEVDPARSRLVYDEFFSLQMYLAMQQQNVKLRHKTPFSIDTPHLYDRLAQMLPFTLTDAQQRVIGEIWADMQRDVPMNRLLQGDVGSGKTVVAAAAMLACIENGRQAVIMAPTEILAGQHFIGLCRLFSKSNIVVDLAVGSLTSTRKKAFRERLTQGVSQIVVGTHALIQEGVDFHKLGLVIIDEQHRFGVLQRAALMNKGENPDVLVMTATPIPRTLTMTVYGDLDLSVIDQMPAGRKPIKTHMKWHSQRTDVYDGLRKLLQAQRQAYVVCPLVQESDKLQKQAAEALAVELQTEILPEFRIGLLHGQLKQAEKESVMEDFRAGKLDVLVSTTVIEVGVDVPNATVMVVEDAERFGLAQLHQLRGRVGRGEHQSYCVLVTESNSETARERLDVLVRTNDGFIIAEQDLRLRGPGELTGTRQSGVPTLRIANIIEDQQLLMCAREDAFELLQSDPKLALAQNQGVKWMLEQRADRAQLASVS